MTMNIFYPPVEMLVCIMSFLTSREQVIVLYVSQGLRNVIQVPALFAEFVWPLYDSREEDSLRNVFEVCRKSIKRLVFLIKFHRESLLD